MDKIRLNVLPSPTFGQLGVNFAERAVGELPSDKIWLEGGCTDITGDAVCSIAAQNGQTVNIIQFINTDKAAHIKTEINAEKYASVSLVQVFACQAPLISQLETKLDENASFDLSQLYIGGLDTVSEIRTTLGGRLSRFNADIAYTLGTGSKLDINLIADHYGKKSVSEINVGGVLNEGSDKVFKGTIDFKSGASGAKGHEKEDVLLAGDNIRNRIVPVILCAEEDVEGSHGATSGRIDDDQIFYMRSRGIPDEQILNILARAKLARVIGKIDDEQVKQRIFKALGWGDLDD